MLCGKLCERFSFGNKSYIKDSKQCVQCDLFIVTESASCACCGGGLIACNDSTATATTPDTENQITPIDNKKPFRYVPHGRPMKGKTVADLKKAIANG
jgi:hypothetical protein